MVEHVTLLPAGCSDLALEALRSAGHNPKVSWQDDSCLVFGTGGEVKPRDLSWAKNHFTVLASVPRGGLGPTIAKLASQVPGRIDLGRQQQAGFRVLAHVDGQLVGLDPRAKQTIESALQRATRARVTPRGGGAEFWVLGRRDSRTMWLVRRTPKPTAAKPAKGALAPELASLLCQASSPRDTDVFLDPFTGSGALPSARLAWPAKQVIAADVASIAWPGGRVPRGVTSLTKDLRELRLDQPVTSVVTDPPWGEFEATEDHDALLDAVPETLAGLADPKGLRLVLLINRRGAERMVERLEAASYRLREPVEVLVNGHPASVLRGQWRA